jgi:hypothetical protein
MEYLNLQLQILKGQIKSPYSKELHKNILQLFKLNSKDLNKLFYKEYNFSFNVEFQSLVSNSFAVFPFSSPKKIIPICPKNERYHYSNHEQYKSFFSENRNDPEQIIDDEHKTYKNFTFWLMHETFHNEIVNKKPEFVEKLHTIFSNHSESTLNNGSPLYYLILLLNHKLKKNIKENTINKNTNANLAEFDFSNISSLELPDNALNTLKKLNVIIQEWDWKNSFAVNSESYFDMNRILTKQISETINDFLMMPQKFRDNMKHESSGMTMVQLLNHNLEQYVSIFENNKERYLTEQANHLLQKQNVEKIFVEKKRAKYHGM